jgi:FKBP-type peptidyl-prolyl cis-trans isomerase
MEERLLYSSDEQGVREFVLDKSDIEAGWNEAAKLMSRGDSAMIILPPHLAFRNIGDGKLIGAGEILIYELSLDSIFK